MKQVVRKTKIKCGEIYIHGGKTLTPKFSIGDHVTITKKRKHFIKDTLKDGWKRFLQFPKFY